MEHYLIHISEKYQYKKDRIERERVQIWFYDSLTSSMFITQRILANYKPDIFVLEE